MMKVRDSRLFASFYVSSTPGKHPGIIVLGGSDGGIEPATTTAALLAEQGYAALALAYFRFEQLPQKLEEIPLEYFKQAIDWMSANPTVESSRIGLMGTSKGGEAALLVSATYPEIKAVVAYVPSHVVFQSVPKSSFRKPTAKSSWTLQSKPVPFVPFRYNLRLILRHGFLLGLYLGGLQDQEAEERAIIPVERINGPILLISGKEDAVWPSSMMCTRVTERLTQYNFGFPFQHLSYDMAGHVTSGPRQAMEARPPTHGRRPYLGGTKTGNALAKDDAWAKACDFLKQHLKQ